MPGFKDNFSDRMAASAKAKRAVLERFQARPGPDDPAMIEREAARQAVIAAREVRMAERQAVRDAEAARVAEAQAALLVEQKAREAAAAQAAAAEAARQRALEVERKRERDVRYAARKQRQGGRR
jgi:hypothetical protein